MRSFVAGLNVNADSRLANAQGLSRELEQRLQEAMESVAAVKEELALTKASHAATSQTLQAVFQSRSWRMTAPVRQMGRAARTVFARSLQLLMSLGWSPESLIKVSRSMLPSRLQERLTESLKLKPDQSNNPETSRVSRSPREQRRADLILRSNETVRRDWLERLSCKERAQKVGQRRR